MVVLGAYTRLVDAGLGCPDWPGCYGFLTVPETPSEVALAERRFPASPVETDKAWPEMIHRYAATLLGLVIVVVLLSAIYLRMSLTLPIVLLLVVILQGIFGAWTVTLKLWPQVVTAHLLGGFLTLALLWFYLIRLRVLPPLEVSWRAYQPAVVLLTFLVLQIALGGWTSSNYAALACPDFPLCHGQFLPDADFVRGFNLAQDVGPNYLGGELSSEARIAIQITHRIGAVVVAGLTLWLLFKLTGFVRWCIAGILVVQFGLGISNVVFNLPLVVATAHNLVAAIFVLAIVSVIVQARTRSSVG